MLRSVLLILSGSEMTIDADSVTLSEILADEFGCVSPRYNVEEVSFPIALVQSDGELSDGIPLLVCLSSTSFVILPQRITLFIAMLFFLQTISLEMDFRAVTVFR